MGTETYEFDSRYNGQQATGVAISMATGANALDTAAGVKEALAELEPYFPPGLKSVVPFDTTPFVQVSIKGVIVTLLEAIALVFLVRSEEHTSELQSLMRHSYAVFCV